MGNEAFRLAVCYHQGVDVRADIFQAFYWYTQAANAGDVDAQYKLALCYDQETGVEVSASQAIYWYTKAADAGHVKYKS